jgi:hypothetical protein
MASHGAGRTVNGILAILKMGHGSAQIFTDFFIRVHLRLSVSQQS